MAPAAILIAVTPTAERSYRDHTNGPVRAHVIRFVPPCRPEEVSYVLKGWISPVN